MLDASTNGQKGIPVFFLRADKLVPYREVMQVMNMLRTARLPEGRPGRNGASLTAMIELAAEDRSDLRRWMFSSLAVLSVYAGLTATLATWRHADDITAAEPSGAIVVDLAPMPAAPSTTPTDIAPGPEQVMSEAQPMAKPERDAAPMKRPSCRPLPIRTRPWRCRPGGSLR